MPLPPSGCVPGAQCVCVFVLESGAGCWQRFRGCGTTLFLIPVARNPSVKQEAIGNALVAEERAVRSSFFGGFVWKSCRIDDLKVGIF